MNPETAPTETPKKKPSERTIMNRLERAFDELEPKNRKRISAFYAEKYAETET